MIKFNDQSERKWLELIRMDSWLLKLPSRDMKTETKTADQPTNNIKK